uniref:Ubiquinone/menaquinone biosynthesis C-methylase UbiE n=1 Tax=Candidatus Kentrum sp. FW TaxID=2126338 RepID=A0A450U0N7_9GAMM|nr:MAG: Ubiquinone/menaquinone biosynthesis C-methylase UbiE [Candidatus Kentron sp. FW]
MHWKRFRLAPDRSHHVTEAGVAAYAERFDEVLAFHAPGLAPVRRGDEAWHIRPDSSEAYRRRFRRTFGIYEGLAAVIGQDGWHHIHPNGTDLDGARYEWCGNFQGGRCTVRDRAGVYFHITTEGIPAYESRWRYAGDFREGSGVVQADDGRSTHIDPDGHPIHGEWFLDLDVFHKGFARARDEDGWTHVDATGRPTYSRRFAAVEPFYNGQARVECFDGGLEIIDESGQRLVTPRSALRSEFASLSGDMVGFWRTQAICAAVELGVFEALPGTSDDIAEARGLAPEHARRLLRALAELRLTRCVAGDWVATERGEYLKSAHPLTLADAAGEYGRYFPDMWTALPDALRADSAWRAPDIFGEVARDARRADGHHRMLMSYALHDYASVPVALRLRGNERVVDAGGGLGALASLLMKQYPHLRVVVLDRPEVVERAMRRQLGEGIAFQSTDLFQPWDVEADVVVMARVLHDWDDPRALRLLRHARRVLGKGGRIFVVEMLIPEEGGSGGLCDLHLLMTTGGAERTVSEYARLLDEADFDVEGIRRIPALPSIIAGVAR